MPHETKEQRFRRCAAKIADAVTYAINVQKVAIADAIQAFSRSMDGGRMAKICCCPLGAVISADVGRGSYFPAIYEAARLLKCRHYEAATFIASFEDCGGNIHVAPAWYNLGKAYRKRFGLD